MNQSKNCLGCGEPFIATSKRKFYCSRTCSNLKKHTEESKAKISGALKGTVYKQDGSISIIGDEWELIQNFRNEISKNQILSNDIKTLSYDTIRKMVILEQSGQCGECGISEWKGKKIPLEVDHKDGNNSNNERTNLIGLCPNCHSITDTWRGRNRAKNGTKAPISDKDLLEMLLKYNFNFRQSLLAFGIAPKGGNYARCHRLLREYNAIKSNEPVDTSLFSYKAPRIRKPKPPKKVKTKKENFCIDCNIKITNEPIRCPKCSQLKRRKSERPPLEELSKLISTHGYVKTAKIFGVSDTAIRKWIKSYGINPSEIKKQKI